MSDRLQGESPFRIETVKCRQCDTDDDAGAQVAESVDDSPGAAMALTDLDLSGTGTNEIVKGLAPRSSTSSELTLLAGIDKMSFGWVTGSRRQGSAARDR